MGKRKELINVWNVTWDAFVAWSPTNGGNGYHGRNSGITRRGSHRPDSHRMKLYTEEHPPACCSTSQAQLEFRQSRIAYMIVIEWEKSSWTSWLELEIGWRCLRAVIERRGTLKLETMFYSSYNLTSKPLSAALRLKSYGPFLITEKMGKVAYRVQLPSHTKIHGIFHALQLKQYEGNHHSVSIDPTSF